MSNITPEDQARNLRKFFSAGPNTVTRERIFFSRLSFDLKIAAARADYHLNLYEPDVDRDGFDIVVEDQDDALGWFQLKAVLKTAGTAAWKTTVGFLRPGQFAGESFGFDPAEWGRGGGVILIEIDDENAAGDVVYSYTDFHVLAALAERYLIEQKTTAKSKGRPKTARAIAAAQVIARLRNGARPDEIEIPRSVFLEVKNADALLGLMGFRSNETVSKFMIHQTYGQVRINAAGMGLVDDRSIQPLGMIRSSMRDLVAVLSPQAGLVPCGFISPYARPLEI